MSALAERHHQQVHDRIESMLRRQAAGERVTAALQHELRRHLAVEHGQPGLPMQPVEQLMVMHKAAHR